MNIKGAVSKFSEHIYEKYEEDIQRDRIRNYYNTPEQSAILDKLLFFWNNCNGYVDDYENAKNVYEQIEAEYFGYVSALVDKYGTLPPTEEELAKQEELEKQLDIAKTDLNIVQGVIASELLKSVRK